MTQIDPLLARHLAHLRRANARPATLRSRRDILLRMIAWLDGPALADVTGSDLERWQDYLIKKITARSVYTYLSHARTFYRWATRVGALDEDPSAELVLPRLPQRQPRPVPQDGWRTGLRTARGDLFAMLILAGYLAFRSGEIAAVQREDVIRVDGNPYLVVHGKGGKERCVPLPPALYAELAPWLIGKRGPVFVTPRGTPATSRWITNQISGHFRGLGMPYTAHQLRHRAATRLLALTRDLRLVQSFLGHASPATTAGYTQIAGAYEIAGVIQLAGEIVDDLGRPDPDGDTTPPAIGVAA